MKTGMLNSKSLAQTWFADTGICTKVAECHNDRALFRKRRARAGRIKFSIFKIQMPKTECTMRDITRVLSLVFWTFEHYYFGIVLRLGSGW